MKKNARVKRLSWVVVALMALMVVSSTVVWGKTEEPAPKTDEETVTAEDYEKVAEDISVDTKNSEKEGGYTLTPGVYRIKFDNKEAGTCQPIVFAIDEYGNMSAGWSFLSSHMIFGKYTIDDNILILRDNNGDCYKFAIVADNEVAVMLDESDAFQTYGEEYRIQDGDRFTFSEACGALHVDKDGNPISAW